MAVIREDVIKSLTMVARTEGIDTAKKLMLDLKASFEEGSKAAVGVGKSFDNLERSLLPMVKAEQDLSKATSTAFRKVLEDASYIDRAATVVAAAGEKFNSVARQTVSASQMETEALAKKRQAYIEEGKAIRAAADAQAHYNNIIGVSDGSSSGGASRSRQNSAIADQMRQRFAEEDRLTKSEIARRELASAEAAQKSYEMQSRLQTQFGILGRDERAERSAANSLLAEQMAERDQQRQMAEAKAENIRREQARQQWASSAAANQAAINQRLGVGRAGGGFDPSASAFGTGLSDLREKYSPLFKAGQDYRREVDGIRDAHRKGALSLGEYTSAMARARDEARRFIGDEIGGGRVGRLKEKPGERLSLHQARNLGFQVNDIVTGLASGQSLGMIAGQQGGQIFQILNDGPGGLGGSLKRLGGYVKDLMTPVRLLIGGFATFGITAAMAMNDAANRAVALGQSLNGLGAASGLNTRGLNLIAQSAAASSSTTSIAAAQAQARAYAGAGLSGAGISALTGDTTDRFAKSFGVTLEEATKTLASAFRDPSKGALELNQVFGTISAASMETIKRIQDTGDTQRAQKELLDALNKSLSMVTPQITGLGHASEVVKKVLSDFWTRFGEASLGALGKVLGVSDPAAALERAKRTVAEGDRIGIGAAAARGDTDGWFAGREGGMIAQYKAAQALILEAQKKGDAERIEQEKRTQAVLQTQRSAAAAGYIRDFFPEAELRKSLQDKITAILGSDPALTGQSAIATAEALERYRVQLSLVLSPIQQLQLSASLQIQQTLAMTLSQRAATDAQRAYTQTLQQTSDLARAAVAAELARNQAVAEGMRLAMDAARSANNRAELAGLLPGDRDRVLLEQQIRDMRRNSEVYSRPGDDQWRSQVKFGEGSRAGSMWNPSPTGPFGAFSEIVSEAIPLKRLIKAAEEAKALPAVPAGVQINRGLNLDPSKTIAMNDNSADILRRALQEEKYTQVVREANQQTEFQTRLLESQISAYGRSTAEVAEAAKKRELLNAAERSGLDLTPAVVSGIEDAARKYGTLAAATENYAQSIQRISDIRSGVSDAFSAFTGGLVRGQGLAKSLQSAVDSLSQSLLKMANNLIMSGLFGDKNNSGGLLSSMLGSLVGGGGGGGGSGDYGGSLSELNSWSANGNIFSRGNVVPFARGGIVNRPTRFPMANGGTGLMGEAGAEAIMPLRRGSDGKLGVASSGGGGTSVVVNNYSKANVETSESKGPDGSKIIEMMIEEKVGASLASGRHDDAMSGRFSLRPRKVLRG